MIKQYILKSKCNCRRKSMQEKESIIVLRCKLKILSLGITVRHHSARLVMPNSYPRDGIFNQHLTTIKDSYILLLSFGRALYIYMGGQTLSLRNWVCALPALWSRHGEGTIQIVCFIFCFVFFVCLFFCLFFFFFFFFFFVLFVCLFVLFCLFFGGGVVFKSSLFWSYILNEKKKKKKERNVTCIFNVSFLWIEIRICNFYFTSNHCSENEYHHKTKISKSTGAFDYRRGQNLKTQFRDALL